MFHFGENDLIVFAEFVEPPCVGHEIDRLGGVLGEDHLLATVGSHEFSETVVSLFVSNRSLLAQVVDPAMDICAVATVVFVEDVDHLIGCLASSRVVEID